MMHLMNSEGVILVKFRAEVVAEGRVLRRKAGSLPSG